MDGATQFKKLSYRLWSGLGCSDYLAGLILEQQVDKGYNDETTLDIALRTDNTEFVNSSRLDRIVTW